MSDLTTQNDRARAHTHYFKATSGIAEDWIEGRIAFDSEEIDGDVRDLARLLSSVRRSATASLEAQIAATNARADAMQAHALDYQQRETTALTDLARVTQERDEMRQGRDAELTNPAG